MRTWIDRSDATIRFHDGGESPATNATTQALVELCAYLRNEILGKRSASDYDLLLFEVNCDTGRLIAAASTSARYTSGAADACSLRVQHVQDYWYDLLDSGATDEEFHTRISQEVKRLGTAFRNTFFPHIEELKRSCSPNGFTYRVLGNDPGVVIYEEQFLK